MVRLSKEKVDRLKEQLLEPNYTLKDLKGITYRTINYWDEAGFLLRKRRKTEKGWRRFSVIEFIWIKLLDEIRTLNITIDSFIPILFKAFGYTSKDTGKGIEAAQIQFLNTITPIIIEKKSIILRIFVDKAEIEDQGNIKDVKSNFENYVSISLNKLLIDFVINHSTNKLSHIPILNEHETELINLINNNNWEEIVILVNGQKNIYQFNEKSKKDDLKEITESIFKPYSKITYKTKGGKTVTLERDI